MTRVEIDQLRDYLQSLPLLDDKDRPRRVARAKRDLWYMITTYFSHHVEGATKDESRFRKFVHKRLSPLLTEHRIVELTAYRGAAKTTTVSNLFVLQEVIRSSRRFILTISSTDTLAKSIFEVVKVELEENHRFRADHEIVIQKSNDAEIILEVAGHLMKLQCAGSGAKIRGIRYLSWRPDLIVLDDIENDEQVESKTQRAKLYRWYTKTIKKLPSRRGWHNILIVGTILHHDSLLSNLSTSRGTRYTNFPLVLDFKSWKLDDPTLDVDVFKEEYAEDKESFIQEYQNIPLSQDSLLFGKYKTYETMPKCDAYFIGVDPAMGKAKGDYFAIAILGWHREQKRFYLTARGYKKNPTDMIATLLSIYVRYSKISRTTLAMEIVAYQEFFRDVFKRQAKAMGLIPIVKSLRNNIPKEIRLNSLAPLIRDETILIDENAHLLLEELDTYPKAPHDDLLDASEMAKRVYEIGGGIDYAQVKKLQKELKRYKTLPKSF